MKKNKKSILGITLVEILIGIVISSIMMAAMYASYTAVNNSFQKVTDNLINSGLVPTIVKSLYAFFIYIISKIKDIYY